MWGHATAVGMTALLTASHAADNVVRVCGAAAGRRPSFRRRMDQLCGVAFLGFAANLLADRP